MKRLALILTLLSTGALAQVEPIDIQTRGQAQVVARRYAHDDAEQKLTLALATIAVGETPLPEWLTTHPEADLAVREALREAVINEDGPEGGFWLVGAEVPINAIREALPPSARSVLTAPSGRAITAWGRAEIPWEGSDANVVSRPAPRQEINLPPTEPSTLPPAVTRPIHVDLVFATWRFEISMTATGTGRTTSAALNSALEEMEASVRDLPVGPETTLGDWAASAPQREQAVIATLARATESDRRLTPDGTCEIDLTIPLRGIRTALEESRP